LEGKADDPLGDMTRLFVDNQARTSEVRVPILYLPRSLLIYLGRIC
jgi:hypothetical protein